MTPPLPIFALARDAWLYLLAARRAWLRGGWPLILAVAALEYLIEGMPLVIPAPNDPGTSMANPAPLLLSTLKWLPLSLLAAFWMRVMWQARLTAAPADLGPLRPGLRLLGRWLQYGLTWLLFTLFGGTVAAALPVAAVPENLMIVIFFLAVLAALWLAPLLLMLAPAGLDQPGFGVNAAWRQSAGQRWRLTAGLVLTCLPPALLQMLLGLAFIGDDEALTPQWQVLAVPVAVLDCLLWTAMAGYLLLAWRRLAPRGEAVDAVA